MSGGRWSPHAARIAKQAGYRSVATSRIAAYESGSDAFQLPRVAVMCDTTLAAYQALCKGNGLWRLQVNDFVRETARRMLGNTAYDRLRRKILESTPQAKTPTG